MKIGIIGGGPAGMMAAIAARKKGYTDITILEKNDTLGKKLNITGKGRCNITYVGDNEYFMSNVVTNPKFMLSSINEFGNIELIDFLNSIDVKVKEERGQRVFLYSDDASELTNALKKLLLNLNINIRYSSEVEKIENIKDKFVVTLKNNKNYEFDKMMIACGGKSYPATGSTGDGYTLARSFGHKVVEPRPALVPIKLIEKDECKYLQGVTLKNIDLKIIKEGKVIDKRFGELLYTSNGITGPIVLSASSKINKLNEDLLQKKLKAVIDLKPTLDFKQLYDRLTRDFNKYINKELKNALKDITIEKLIPVIISRSGVLETKKVHDITKEEKEKIVNVLKNLDYTIYDLEKIEAGIVTSGGIDVKEINPKTMESKIIKGLYFVGEVIDVDAYTGGFNLQIAFSTGFVCGNNL